MDGILVAIADPEQILQTLSWLEGALKETFTISTCAPGPDAERVSLSKGFDLIILDGGSDVEIIRAQQSVINGSPPVIVAWIAQSHLKPVDGADVCWDSTMSHLHMLDSLANVLTFGGTQVVPSDEKPAERREACRQGPHVHRIGRKGWHSFSKAVSEKSVSPLQRLQWFFKKRGPLRTNNGLPPSSLLGANGVAACVVGCGMMGVAIAGELMRRGCTVRLFDYLHSARSKAVQRIQTNVHRLNATGVLAPDDAARIMPRCGVAETLSDAISGAVLIIEAICDDRNAKRTLHAEMAEALAELRADLKRVVICSTSAILSPHTVLTSVSSQYGKRVVRSVFHYPCWFVDEVDFRGDVDVGPGWHFALRIFNQLGFRAVHVRQQGAHAPPSRAACESIAHAPAPLAASSAEEAAAGEASEPSASESKMGRVSEAAGKNLRRARLKATQAVLVSEPFKSFQRCLSTRSTVAASSNEPVAGLETGLEAGLEASLGQSACRWATAMQRKLSIEWAVVSKVVNSVRTVQPKVYAELVGSYMAGTQTAFSDYDLVLIGCSLPEEQLARLLAQQLPCRRGWSIVEGTTQVIRGTVTTAQGEKWVDIVLPQVDVHGSFRSAVLVSSILCPGMAMLLPVVLVMKHLLFACQLGSSAGGLSSMSLTMMVAAIIWKGSLAGGSADRAGAAMLMFLEHFAAPAPAGQVHSVEVVQSADMRYLLPKFKALSTVDYAQLYIENPDGKFNLAINCSRWRLVQLAFRCLLRELRCHAQSENATSRSAKHMQAIIVRATLTYWRWLSRLAQLR